MPDCNYSICNNPKQTSQFVRCQLQVLTELTHTHEDIYEERLDVNMQGALDAGSEARYNVLASPVHVVKNTPHIKIALNHI